MKRPTIAITMGDPFGIGPEITVKALADPGIYEICRPVVIGSRPVMEYVLALLEKTAGICLKLHVICEPSQGEYRHGVLDLIDLGVPGREDFAADPNKVEAKLYEKGATRAGGEAGYRYVEKAIALAMAGEVDGTVTNPISKEALHMAGHRFAGHTEIYAKLTGTKSYAMMLSDGDLRVIHVSTHVSLREACDRVKKARVLECIRLADEAMKKMGMEHPKIGVAGLNPHAGENGLFGTEETEEILPAIHAAREEGILAEGPLPPDTAFSKARGGWYDIVVVMYHDQGHIPLKTVGFVYDREKKSWEAVRGVNVTLGLPIVRTSVDHGTAFDQAGLGTASELSLIHAIRYACALC